MNAQEIFAKAQEIVTKIRRVDRNLFDDYDDYRTAFIGAIDDAKKELGEVGFKFLGKGAYSHAFGGEVEDMGRIVVKFSIAGLNLPTDEQLDMFPLLKRRYLKPIMQSDNVAIQPWCDCPPAEEADVSQKLHRAARRLSRWFNKLYDKNFDCWAKNVGYYKGKLMIFDPLI